MLMVVVGMGDGRKVVRAQYQEELGPAQLQAGQAGQDAEGEQLLVSLENGSFEAWKLWLGWLVMGHETCILEG